MEFVQMGQYIAAFAMVVGLIGLMGIGMRKFGNPAMRMRKRDEARLAIVETLALDARSRLYIIRRDDVEHLLVKSGDRVEVIECDIPFATEEGEDEEPTAATATGPKLMFQATKEPASDAA